MSSIQSSSQTDLGNVTSFDTFIEHPSQGEARPGQCDATVKMEGEGGLSSLNLSLPVPGPVWGWLVPGHPSKPQMSVIPLSLLPGEVFKAGREPGSSLVFQEWMVESEDSSSVMSLTSRLHFEIIRQEDKTLIVDRSENGTFVRGGKLRKDHPRILKHGDLVSVINTNNELFWYLDEATMLYTNHFPLPVIRKYLTGNMVGKGTFGSVIKGFSRSDLKPVALKFLSREKIPFVDSDNPTEVRILKSLDHPCVTKLKDVVVDRDTLVIVMEFAEGGELNRQVYLDWVMDRLSEETAKIQFYQICSAVDYIHGKNICHRDLKLSNILMASPHPRSRLMVSDFGISKVWSTTDQLRSYVGTPSTMAPEVRNNIDRTSYTYKSDCWSLGVILYQLLSGHTLHQKGGDASNERWEAVSDLSRDLVAKLTQEDPDSRLTARQALEHNWFAGDAAVCRRARNIMEDKEDGLVTESISSLAESKLPLIESSSSQSGSGSAGSSSLRDPSSTSSQVVEVGSAGSSSPRGSSLTSSKVEEVGSSTSTSTSSFSDEVKSSTGSSCSKVSVIKTLSSSEVPEVKSSTESSSLEVPEVKTSTGSSSSTVPEVNAPIGSSSSEVPEAISTSSRPMLEGSPSKDPSSTGPEREERESRAVADMPMEEVSKKEDVEEGGVGALRFNWRSKKELMTESDEELKENFDSIKSRLRPRIPVNYNQFSARNPPVTPGRGPRKGLEVKPESVKRKINMESRQVTFLLPANKRRRRVSEHQSRVREEVQTVTGRGRAVLKKQRRSSGPGK